MGNLVIPKHCGEVTEIIAALKVYYDAKGKWVENKDLIKKLEPIVGYGKGGSSYTKKGQVPAYFGFIEWEDITDKKSKRRITDKGIRFYEAYTKKDKGLYQKILIESLSNTVFGRDNYGSYKSESDVEPPNVFIRSILDLGSISKNEFGYLLYLLANKEIDYKCSLAEIMKVRNNNGEIVGLKNIKDNNKHYFDAKPILALERFGIIKEVTAKKKSKDKSKRYKLEKDIKQNYYLVLSELDIYNNETRNITSNIQIELLQDNIDDLENIYNKSIDDVDVLSQKDKDTINNRTPEMYISKKGKKYKTNPRVKKTAIKECGYKCFNDNTHILFKKKDGTNYVEGHHIIPMAAQSEFEDINLDRTENVVALCPYCHKAIHHGDENTVRSILDNIFKYREEDLKEVGISINKEELYIKYYR